VPQVKHKGESTLEPVMTSSSSAEVCTSLGAGFTAAFATEGSGRVEPLSDSASPVSTSDSSSSAGASYEPVSS
jgi:hypothetical protein